MRPDWLKNIPSSWSSAPFGSLFTQSKRKNSRLQRDFVLSVMKDRGVIPHTEKGNVGNKVSEDLSGYKLVDKGDFVLNSMNLYMGSVGVSAYDGVTSTAYIVCKPSEEVYAGYYNYLIQFKGFQEYVGLLGKGIMEIREAVRWTALKSVSVPVPNFETQRQIADFLDRETERIDLLIERKRRLVELLGEREEGTFIDHVTGKDLSFEKKHSGVEWIKEIPSHWFAPKFTHVARQETGHTPSRKVDDYWVPEECVIPWVSLADVWQLRDGGMIYISDTAEKISEVGMENSSARLLPKDTVILSRTASVGFPGIIAKPMATTQDFAAWICGKQIRPQFLYYVLRAMKPEFRRLMMGSTHQTIYMPDIRSFRTPLPPVQEQDQIIARLSSTLQVFRKSAAALTTSIDRLKEYRSALITAAVTGQIDVETYAKQGTADRRLDTIQEEMQA